MIHISNCHNAAKVQSVESLNVELLEIRIRIDVPFTYEVGQYIWLVLYEEGNIELGRRAFSITNVPNENNEIVLLARVSKSLYKMKLKNLQIGEHVTVIGPFGSVFKNPDPAVPLILLGAGTGIAPFLSIVRKAITDKSKQMLTFQYFEREEKHRIYLEEIQGFNEQQIPSTIHKNFSWKLINNIPYRNEALYYISGPQDFVDAVYKELKEIGIEDHRMRFEAEYPHLTDDQKKLHSLFYNGRPRLPSDDMADSIISQFKLLTSLIEASTNHTVVTDYNGEILYANSAAELATGFTYEEMQGNTPRLWGGLMEEDFYKRLWKSKKSGESVDEVIVNRKKSGELYYAKAHVSPIKDGGLLLGWIATEEDITELELQKQSMIKANEDLEDGRRAMLNILEDNEEQKKKLESISQRLGLAAKAGGIGVWDWDIVRNILTWDDQMYNLYGITREEFSGAYEAWRQGVHPEDRERGDQEIQAAVAGTKEFDTTFRVLWPDQSVHYIRAFADVVRDQNNKPIKMVGVNFDVTKEKELEKVKDDFLSLASHELRTPMTAIRGLVSMVLEGDYGQVSEDIRQPLQDVEVSTKNLINLVNDMLNVSRIEAGRLKFDLSEFDLGNRLSQTCNLLQSIAQEKGIQLQFQPVQGIIVQADEEKVNQMLTNLIGNSLKFTDEGAVTVETKIDGERAVVSVTDQGIGISTEDQAKLFGKFQQIDSKVRGKAKGTGLGLYLSRALARKMGGDLWIAWSEPGKGSTFAFSVPLAQTQLAQKAKAAIDKEAELNPDQKS